MNRCRHVIAIGVLLSLCAAAAPAQPTSVAPPPAVAPAPLGYGEVVERARALVQADLAERGYPGIALAVAVDQETVWSEGFGSAKHLLFTEQQTRDGDGVGYGFGWFIRTDDEGRRLLYHSGGSVGGTSMMIMQPDTGVVVVGLINLTGARNGVVREVLRLFVDARTEEG